jgi:hypothetical protein
VLERVLLDVVPVRRDAVPDELRGVLGPGQHLGDGVEGAGADGPHHFEDQLLLGAEAVVEDTDLHPGLGDDGARGGVCDPVSCHDGDGRLDEQRASFGRGHSSHAGLLLG